MAHIFFDFDSTLVSVETLDEVISHALDGDIQKQKEVETITNQGMSGEIDLFTSLNTRLSMAAPTESFIDEYAKTLPEKITTGLANIISDLQKDGHTVCIISGGFKDYMQATADALNIKHIYANTFIYENDKVAGLDAKNPLCKNHGKGKVIQSLNILEPIVMVGDGMTDLEVFKDGACDHFIGFGIHQQRQTVQENAPHFIKNIEAFKTLINKLIQA